ncbi:MAG: hypothetical protein WCJ81_03320 [bacterium]
MNGYPRGSSPFCAGQFCGTLPITNADFIQTLFNIAAQTFYAQYQASRGAISQRLSNQPAQIQNYFDLGDRAVIATQSSLCAGASCQISSSQSLQTYVKYCMYNPSSCGMSELPIAKT